MSGKIDDELKSLTTNYTEKNLALATLKRKKQINLCTSDFEDFLTPELVAKLDFQDTEHFLTIMVVVPKALETGNKRLSCLWFSFIEVFQIFETNILRLADLLLHLEVLIGPIHLQSAKMMESLVLLSNVRP
jgi:hypothetical protein